MGDYVFSGFSNPAPLDNDVEAVLPSKQNEKPYVGILAEPMPNWTALTAPTPEELKSLIDEKMKALFIHYGLNPAEAFQPGPRMAAAWANLAWHLARQHVPGFHGPPKGRGKPATRKEDDIDLGCILIKDSVLCGNVIQTP